MSKTLKFSDVENTWNEKKYCVECRHFHKSFEKQFDKCTYSGDSKDYTGRFGDEGEYITTLKKYGRYHNANGDCQFYAGKKKWYDFFLRFWFGKNYKQK